MKLTDSQLVILSAAAKRADGSLLPLPKSIKLNKGAATLVLKSLLKNKLVAERIADQSGEAWREADDGARYALAIASAGLKAIGIEELPARDADTPKDKKPTAARKSDRPSAAAKQATRKGSKISVLVDLLSRKNGATIEEAAGATGWQHHSVRGAISGALKKKMGLTISSSQSPRGRVYRIG